MIIVKLTGGNGNQMFQYAAGFALAKKQGTHLLLDNKYLLDNSKRYFRHENRNYALEMFNISAQLADNKQISKFTVPRIGNKYIYHLKKRIIPSHNVFQENNLTSIKSLFNLPEDAYLDGYWQNEAYFKDYEDDIRREFSFKNKLPEFCNTVSGDIIEKNSVCVIFRRGDFVNHPILDVVKIDYYYRALEIIKAKIKNPHLFVFSDDIQWCKDNFKPDSVDFTFVDRSLTGPDAEYYLHMISLCKHFIIPNSTFGWWGAWLAKHTDKVIIAPQQWYIGQTETRHSIIPDSWIAI